MAFPSNTAWSNTASSSKSVSEKETSRTNLVPPKSVGPMNLVRSNDAPSPKVAKANELLFSAMAGRSDGRRKNPPSNSAPLKSIGPTMRAPLRRTIRLKITSDAMTAPSKSQLTHLTGCDTVPTGLRSRSPEIFASASSIALPTAMSLTRSAARTTFEPARAATWREDAGGAAHAGRITARARVDPMPKTSTRTSTCRAKPITP